MALQTWLADLAGHPITSYVLAAVGVLGCAAGYRADLFAAIVLRSALAQLDERTLATTMGFVHRYGDRRLVRACTITGTVRPVREINVIEPGYCHHGHRARVELGETTSVSPRPFTTPGDV